MPVVYIGVDPGLSGGLACLGHSGTSAVACKMPDSDEGILHWLRSHKGGLGVHTFCILEQVGGWIPKKVKDRDPYSRQPGSAMFKFGDSYGSCRMACVACGLKPMLITPRVWQAGFLEEISAVGGVKDSPGRDGKDRGESTYFPQESGLRIDPPEVLRGCSKEPGHKAVLKQVAQRLFPELRVTMATCDALLLAEYCRRLKEGTLRTARKRR